MPHAFASKAECLFRSAVNLQEYIAFFASVIVLSRKMFTTIIYNLVILLSRKHVDFEFRSLEMWMCSVGVSRKKSESWNLECMKYTPLVLIYNVDTNQLHFFNLSVCSLGSFGNSCHSFLEMRDSLLIDEQHTRYFISKLSTISILTTFYIFCYRSKPRTDSELLPF